MTCFAPENLIALLERGGLNNFGPDERAHLAKCAPCQEKWASIAAADGVLRDAPRGTRQEGRAPWMTALAAAALMIAVIGLGFWIRSRPQALSAATPQADPKEVAALIAALDSEDPATRGAAEARLVKLGASIRPQLEDALKKAASEETRARIRSILQKYTLVDEEQYALRRLERNDPFPNRLIKRDQVKVDNGTSVADAIEHVARSYALKVEFYSGDNDLVQEASRTPIVAGFVIENGDAETALSSAVSNSIDATTVVDGDRLIVVRFTPSVLLARIDLTSPEAPGQWILHYYEGTSHDYWKGPMHFLASRGNQGGDTRRKWVEVLSSRALDASHPVDLRRRALRGLQAFFGRSDKPQPDVTEVFQKVFRQKGEPDPLRTEALLGLTDCMEPEARETLLAVIESREPVMSRRLLSYWMSRGGMYSSLAKIREDAPSRGRFEAALRGLEDVADGDLALRALALDATLDREEAAVRLSKSPEPADPATLDLAIWALRIGADHGWVPVLDRIDALAAHPNPKVRAVVAGVYGRQGGGIGRERDVKGALALLADREPIVRWAAAHALGTIYSSSAAERYFDGWPACRDRLDAALKTEAHPKVRSQLEEALRAGSKN